MAPIHKQKKSHIFCEEYQHPSLKSVDLSCIFISPPPTLFIFYKVRWDLYLLDYVTPSDFFQIGDRKKKNKVK